MDKDISEMPKSKPHHIADIIDYAPGAIATQIIIHKITGNIRALALDSGHSLSEKISPFDTFIQIIEGKAEIIIDGKSNSLATGQCIIVPANSNFTAKALVRFKMLACIIKSGYES